MEFFHFSPLSRRIFQSSHRGYDIESDQESSEKENVEQQRRAFEEVFFDEAGIDANCEAYIQGVPEDHYVTKYFDVPSVGFGECLESVSEGKVTLDLIARVGLSGDNVTVPVALMLLDPDSYPSVSKSRKMCR